MIEQFPKTATPRLDPHPCHVNPKTTLTRSFPSRLGLKNAGGVSVCLRNRRYAFFLLGCLGVFGAISLYKELTLKNTRVDFPSYSKDFLGGPDGRL